MRTARLNTREVAALLKCRPQEAVALLRAAKIPFIQFGRAFGWDAAAVEKLIAALSSSEAVQR